MVNCTKCNTEFDKELAEHGPIDTLPFYLENGTQKDYYCAECTV